MSRASTWTNSDGLVVGFGTHTKDNDVAAVTSERGSVKTLVLEINGTSVPSSWAAANVAAQAQAVLIKRGAIIHRATFETVVAFTGSSSTLNIGTYGGAAFTTADDADGIDATIALTAMDAIGETVICDGALVGGTVPVGATSDSDVMIGFTYGTAALTAGKGILTIQYTEPSGGNTIAA